MNVITIADKNNWRIKKLSDVTFYQEGPGVRKHQYRTSGVKLLNVANLQNGKVDLSTSERYITEEEAYGKYNHFLVDEGDLIIACSGIKVEYFEKKMGFARSEHLPLCMNTSTMRFKVLDEKELDINYLAYYLKTKYFKKQIQRLITGSAQLNFGPSHIKQVDILLPPLQTQKKIVEVLDKAQELIDARKEQIKLLDDLIQSIFYDMFGDPVTNPKGWEKSKIKKNVTFIDYRGKTPVKSCGGVPLITAKNVKFGFYSKEPKEFISNDLYKSIMTRGYPKVNDVLFTTEGATLGNVCRIPNYFQNFAVGQRLITLVCKNYLIPEYLQLYLMQKYTQDEILKRSTGSAARGIRSREFAQIQIHIPPINLQNQFAQKVQKIEQQKELMQQSLTEMENNFNSLMQRAFKGDL